MELRDRKNFDRIVQLAKLLDNSIAIPFTRWRIGLDPLAGLIPGLGDSLGLIASFSIIYLSTRLGASKRVLMRMSVNVIIDAFIGIFPLVGDLLDFAFKANEQNVRLLRAEADGGRLNPRSAGGTQKLLLLGVVFIVFTISAILFAFLGSLIYALVSWTCCSPPDRVIPIP